MTFKLTSAAKKLLPFLGEDVALPPLVLNAAADLLAEAPKGAPRLLTLHEGDRTWLLVHGEDMPFLTDTVLMTVQAHGHTVGNLWHPVLQVGRTAKGLGKVALSTGVSKGKMRVAGESLIAFSLSMPVTEALSKALTDALADVQAAVADFGAMQRALADARSALTVTRTATRAELDFLDWLAPNFIMLGALTSTGKLGMARHRDFGVMPSCKGITLATLSQHATVHRGALLCVVSVPHGKGQVLHLIGLFSSRAYAAGVGEIPLVKDKVEQVQALVLGREKWPVTSHAARTLRAMLSLWPRDELFLATPEELAEQAVRLVKARDRFDVGVLVRYAGATSAVVQLLVPLAHYESRHRPLMTALCEKAFGTRVLDYRLEVGDAMYARLLVHLSAPKAKPSEDTLTEAVRQLVMGWQQQVQALDPVLAATWGRLAPADYVAETTPARAVEDFKILDTMPADRGAVCAESLGDGVELRLYSAHGGWPLHVMIPVIQSTGLLTQHENAAPFGDHGHVQVLQAASRTPVADERIAALQEVILDGLNGGVVDDLNRLTIIAALSAREVTWLRAWVAYAQQIDARLSPESVRALLLGTPAFARGLVKLFHVRHNPKKQPFSARAVEAELGILVEAFPTAAQEFAARVLVSMIRAMVRTNAFSGSRFGGLAFKVNSKEVHGMPHPWPYREIFVWHPLVEGVHLRGGPVARGGLRHSDRGQDYRVEVLGLMTAQMRKNTIIVPVGAKGGFFIKGLMPSDRAEYDAAFAVHYRCFVDALLSVSDAYDAQGKVVPPRGVVCHDGGDPYLVVAADKGTAKMSDTANALSETAAYWEGVTGGFWLADAFASGGSHGYDHKAMGITAKGAWISVAHHLANMGRVPSAKEPLRVVGVGDMGGDVFGNGLLREKHTHLLAAFNHMHIFLDPTPDAAASFAERKRLFDAGQGWGSYNPALISKGGGVFSRTAKSVKLSPQVQKALGIKASVLTPDELVKAILMAPVDVIWNGGIGTYIKASGETHADAADKANDAVRVDARQVRAKVIGEGGNLGITPRGRIELALRGVHLNTDALDNSAGVDTSDHEVNLKILLARAMRQGKLTRKAYEALLPTLTQDIEEAVLADNHAQNMVLTLMQAAPAAAHAQLHGWQDKLEREGVLAPHIDVLPTQDVLSARPAGAYTRPELCALMAGTKAWLQARLQENMGALEGLDGLDALLLGYFPPAIRKAYAEGIQDHLLRPALLATLLANLTVNRWGLGMVPQLMGATQADAVRVVGALWLGARLMRADVLWEVLDNHALPQAARVQATQRLHQAGTVLAEGLLRQTGAWAELQAALVKPVLALGEKLPLLLGPQARQHFDARLAQWKALGFDEKVACHLCGLSPLAVLPDAVQLAASLKKPVADVAQAHLAMGELLHMPALMRAIRVLPTPDDWSRQAVAATMQEILWRQLRLTQSLMQGEDTDVAAWAKARPAVRQVVATVGAMLREKELTLAMVNVLLGQMRTLEA